MKHCVVGGTWVWEEEGRKQMALRKSRPVTIADLKHLATKADLARFATKADLENFAIRADFENFATKADFEKCATTVDLKSLAAKTDVEFLRADVKFLRDDFGSYRSEFTTFKDWTQITLGRVVKDIDDVKQEVGVLRDARLKRLHDRLTKVEGKVGLPTEEYF